MKNLLIQEAGASALRLCPQLPNISKGTRYYFEIQQVPNGKTPLIIRMSKDVKRKEMNYATGKDEIQIHTIQDSHQEFDNIDQAIDFLNRMFDMEYYFQANEKMLRCGSTVEQILGLPYDFHETRILENDVLTFIAANPEITDRELISKFGKDTAGYVDRWKHDYGQGTTPFIEPIKNGWIITVNGLKFIEDKGADY